jgi:hypothetical protein
MHGAVAAYCILSLIPAHSLPDNHLERGVQVLVFPDRVEIHYRLGLSDRQVFAELEYLGDPHSATDDIAAALPRYRRHMADSMANHLSVRVDGELRPVSFRNVYREERHHVRFVVVCGADVSVGSQPVKMEVRDETPPGAAAVECRRMALRGRTGVVVTESTGKTTLVRVPRRPVVAGDLDTSHPSRRIVAFCRLAGAEPERDGTAGNRAELKSRLGDAPRGEPAPTVDAEVARQSTASDAARDNSSRHWAPGTIWLVAGGVVLVIVGVGLALFVKRRGQ